jgi:phosphatidylglycerol:prolipoprotein diacylglycerol transferase
MHPTLITIGTLNIPTYTLLLDLGLVLGLLLTYYEGKRQLHDGTLALDLGLWSVIGGIVGGRLAYVFANWPTFSEDWARAIRIWEGGLSFHGAFLGGLLVMAIFAQVRQRDQQPVSFWEMADVITLGLALGIAFGWAACLMGGCAYGALGEGFGYAILPDLYGVEASRFASQVAGLAFSVALFLGILLLRGHWPFAGASFLMYVLLYFAGQFFLEFSRGDEALYLGTWRVAQVLNLAIALAAAVGLLVLWWRASKSAQDQEERSTEASDAAKSMEEGETDPPALITETGNAETEDLEQEGEPEE